MAAEYQLVGLMNLPDELIMHIASNLHAIRSFEVQSQAFKLKEIEKARQRESHLRRRTLYALCLTSRRCKAIAEPLLYSACMSSSTWNALLPLRLFLRTITEQPTLAGHVQYIENRLSDHLGNDLYHDSAVYGAIQLVKEYYETLAAVIRQCPNLVHLSVVSLETDNDSLWRHLIEDNSGLSRMATHGLPKLQTLCLQIHTYDAGLSEASSWFGRIANALLKVPTLEEFRASGVTTADENYPDPAEGNYASLHTIEISHCILDFADLVGLAAASTRLKHLSAHWAYLNSQGTYFPDLHKALESHKDTLEYLHLDTREIRFNEHAHDYPIRPLGSLREFTALKHLVLDEVSLLAENAFLSNVSDKQSPVQIAHLLPPSLNYFNVLIQNRFLGHDVDEAHALWDLANDCSQMLPNLKEFAITASCKLQAPNLIARFKEKEIRFALIEDGDSYPFDEAIPV